MKNNEGITLISLISSLLLILILASFTIVASTNAYNQMKFEGAKSEIEQMQKKVDEIASDYQTYLKEGIDVDKTEYQYFFKERYGSDFQDKLIKQNEGKAETLLNKYASELSVDNTETFYFTTDDLVKFFDLKGIGDIVVNFSTRKVYSVDGIKDPDDKTKIYYTSSEWGDNKVISYTGASNDIKVTATKGSSYTNSNGVKITDITLTVTGKINKIAEVYVGKVEGSDTIYSKSDDYTVSSESEKFTIKVRVTGDGSYKFKVVDELNNSYETTNPV